MIRKEQDGIAWLEFELLSDFSALCHAVFLRNGGVSIGPFSSLNLGRQMGDDPRHVEANIQRVCKLIRAETLVEARQCHGKRVAALDRGNVAHFPECDALATAEKNIALKMTHADCQAAIFYDPVHHAVANVHCGWRGNVQNIYLETIKFLSGRYRSKPADLHVCISPSLGPERSEFINYRRELPESFWEFQFKPLYFDLWAISEKQLIDAGILPHHLQIARISTYANPHDYFSYRRSKTTGCHGTITYLK